MDVKRGLFRVLSWGVLDGTVRCSSLLRCLVSSGRWAPLEACYFGWFYHNVLDKIIHHDEINILASNAMPNWWWWGSSTIVFMSQNRPIYKSTSTMAARKRSHCHTWTHINPVVRRVPRRVSINDLQQPRSYMIQHTCHILHKVHRYISSSEYE